MYIHTYIHATLVIGVGACLSFFDQLLLAFTGGSSSVVLIKMFNKVY